MPQETSQPASPTASPEKRALLEAFDTVLKTQAEQREAERAAVEARRRGLGASRLLMVVCTTIMLFTGVYLYVERPEWVFPRPAAPESLAVREASLRITIANAAQHIERYRKQSGKLPTSLQQAGAHGNEIGYQATSTGYRLLSEAGGLRLSYDSSEPLSRFVGNSFQVIARRAQ
jgi:hypothetical protein